VQRRHAETGASGQQQTFEDIHIPADRAQRGGGEQTTERAADNEGARTRGADHARSGSSTAAALSACASTAADWAPLIACPATRIIGTECTPSICACNPIATTSRSPAFPWRKARTASASKLVAAAISTNTSTM